MQDSVATKVWIDAILVDRACLQGQRSREPVSCPEDDEGPRSQRGPSPFLRVKRWCYLDDVFRGQQLKHLDAEHREPQEPVAELVTHLASSPFSVSPRVG